MSGHNQPPAKENTRQINPLPKRKNIEKSKDSAASSTNRESFTPVRLGLVKKDGSKRGNIDTTNNVSTSREALSVRLSLAERNASMAKNQMIVHKMNSQSEEALDAEESYHAFCLEISKLKKKIIQLDQQRYFDILVNNES